MTGLPLWNRQQDPAGLLRYVHTGVASSVIPELPARAEDHGAGPFARTMTVLDLFAAIGIRYADEPLGGNDGWQEIRPPSAVLEPPRLATCVDIAVAFAGACLDAGVHPLLALLEPVAGGPWHVVLVTWLGGPWTGTGGLAAYRRERPELTNDGPLWPGGLRSTVDCPGAFLPIDVVRLTADGGRAGEPVAEDAVAAGAQLLTDGRWRVATLIDVGSDYDPRGALPSSPRSLSGIVSHVEMVAGLGGLQRNLISGNLSFVPPRNPASPLSPSNLLLQLADKSAPQPGTLLVGAAGVGKTRTCFEVADLALLDGWAVLHVTAGEPVVTIAELHDAILAARSERVLVVLDYLNECHIDLPALRHRIMPAATAAGVAVAFLASCRPGWRATTDKPIDLVFESLALEPDVDQVAEIRDTVIKTVAPKAIATLGLDRLRELCGLRPIIAMLIAAEAERLAEEHSLTAVADTIRSGHLLHWLDRRLQEDQLLPAPVRNPFDDVDPSPSVRLQACVAMLAAAPQPFDDLTACGDMLPGLPEGQAARLLSLVRGMGWVVDGPTGVGPVHDLVTDHLLEKILIDDGPAGGVRLAVVDRVLDACSHRPRTIGRYATNLGRALRDLAAPEALTHRCAKWFRKNAGELGDILAEPADEGAYALGAVLENPAWSAVTFESWDKLAGPWLDKHAFSLPARHLYYRGLRSAPPDAVMPLAAKALGWLSEHGMTLEASFVLDRLLRIGDGSTSAAAVAGALTWLDRHKLAPEAQYVLVPLFKCDMDKADAERMITFALAWLEQHDTAVDASFLISSMLGNDDAAAKARPHALNWLERHARVHRATFVLSALLGEAPGNSELIAQGVAWLDEHCALEEASFMLYYLLNCGPGGAHAEAVKNHALRWLNLHPTARDVSYVIPPLLRLHGVAVGDIEQHARAWLTQHGMEVDAHALLKSLLRSELDVAAEEVVMARAMDWLDVHGLLPSGQFVLAALLERDELGRYAQPIIDRAVAWVEVNGVGSDLVSKFVVRRKLLTEPIARSLIDWAIKNPKDSDVAWRLVGVARLLREWPHLTDRVLDAVEMVLSQLPRIDPVNSRSQFDGLLNSMCGTIRTGVAGARLDEMVAFWVVNSQAFTTPCPAGAHYLALVSRTCSLLLGRHVPPVDVDLLLDRLERWIDQWNIGESPERETAQALVMLYRGLDRTGAG